MKTGFVYAAVAFIGTIVVLSLVSFAVGAVWSVKFVPERLGEIIGRIAWFLAFVAFVIGWIRQANRKRANVQTKQIPAPKPENLQPIDYSKLSSLYDDLKT